METLIIIFFILCVIFLGIFIYGAIRYKKIGTNIMWVGCIGMNVCNVVMQIANVIRIAMP